MIDIYVWLYFCNICRISRELEKEAKIHKLCHTNIVELFAVISEPSHYGIVMEYVLHGALDDYIHDNNVCCSVSFFIVHLLFRLG